jgi:hypothetical protein
VGQELPDRDAAGDGEVQGVAGHELIQPDVALVDRLQDHDGDEGLNQAPDPELRVRREGTAARSVRPGREHVRLLVPVCDRDGHAAAPVLGPGVEQLLPGGPYVVGVLGARGGGDPLLGTGAGRPGGQHDGGCNSSERGRESATGGQFMAGLLRRLGKPGLDRLLEHFGDLEREGPGIVAAGLDGVDGLAGDVESVGEVGVTPPSDDFWLSKAVTHGGSPRLGGHTRPRTGPRR